MNSSPQQTPEEFFKEVGSKLKLYSLVLLKKGPNYNPDQQASAQLVMEHAQYLLSLRAQGILNINGPIGSEGELVGAGIYNSADMEVVKALVEADPGVKSGRFVYEIHPFYAFPGDALR